MGKNLLIDYESFSPDEMKFSEESSPRAVDVTGDSCFSFPQYQDLTAERVPLRTVSYNIHGWRDTFHIDNLGRIISVLSAAQADVITLQEVLHPYHPPAAPEARDAYFQRVKAGKGNGFKNENAEHAGNESYLHILAGALGMPYVSFGQATSDGYFGAFGYGNAVLSRFPILNEEHLVIKADEKHQAGRRIEAEDRCFSAVTLSLSESFRYTVCVTHLDQLSDDLRQEQVQQMLKRTSLMGSHLFCGDFNVFQKSDCSPAQWAAILADATSKGWPAPPETTAALQALLSAGYQDCFYLSDNHRRATAAATETDRVQDDDDSDEASSTDEEVEAGGKVTGEQGVKLSEDGVFPGATCWVVKPLLRIDYAFLSPPVSAPSLRGGAESVAARVRRYERIMDEGSDHFPILIDITLERCCAPRGCGEAAAAAEEQGMEIEANN